MKLVECVPNISEGRRADVIEAVAAAAAVPGVTLLNVDPGADTNRLLSDLMARGAVLHFERAHPTLQDIFVRIADPDGTLTHPEREVSHA